MSRPSTHSAVLGFEATISENGRVCTPCYEAQLVILKEDTVSTDDDLRSLISELKASLLSIGNIKSEDDILNQATYSTAVYVGERLLMQQCHQSMRLSPHLSLN